MRHNNEQAADYSKSVVATAQGHELHLQIKPDTDLDTRFRAWDTDENEFIAVNGWLFQFQFDDETHTPTGDGSK